MDTDAQWPEGIGVVKVPQVMEVNNSGGAAAIIDHQRNNNNNNNNNKGITTKKPPPALNCPRCNSGNTKFCYYNNYSLTQPRYFCKTCRRYWTEGGSLRNVPVGGGSRKNKRSSASSSSSSLSSKIKLNLPEVNSQNPNKIMFHDQGRHDLNLAYPQSGPSATYNYMSGNNISEFVEFPSTTTTNTSSSSHHISQLLTSGIGGGRGGGFSSFMSMIPVSDSNGLPNFQEFSKPISGLNFSLDHNYGSLQGVVHHQESSNTNMNTNTNTTTSHAKLFFPFEDLKVQPVISTTSTQELMEESKDSQGDHHHQQQQATEYWNQGLGGGGSW